MGKIVLFTQRVEVVPSYGERRDCADQKIAGFLRSCGYLPVPVGNHPEYLEEYVDTLGPAGIVLTGGNDLAEYGGNAPERDAVEHRLIELALERDIPLIGFCRGMQMIACHFGGKLAAVTGHTAVRHRLHGMYDREVNSYHNYAVADVPAGFETAAWAEDEVPEMIRHTKNKIMGIMWHPERETPFQAADITMFSDFIR